MQGLNGKVFSILGAEQNALEIARFVLRNQGIARIVLPGLPEDKHEQARAIFEGLAVEFEFGPIDLRIFQSSAMVVVCDGFPIDLRELDAARNMNIPVVSELEFVSLHSSANIVAVVGTNGKSTTAQILKLILEKQNVGAFANIDRPLSAVLNESTTPDYIIAACSPQQLEGTRTFKPKGILFLNLAEDMTDRYPNIENYFQANREVLKNADAETWVVFNSQDNTVVSFVQNLQGKTYLFGMQEIPSGFEGAWCQKNKIAVRWKDNQLVELDISQLKMRGFHNRENLMAAALAALNLGVRPEAIQKTIAELKALPHRVQFVKRINDVAFYSDAYATNPAAVIRTLGSFVEPVILIMGGKDKEVNFSPLAPHIRLRVKNLIITGESKEKINRFLGDYTETFLVGTLEEATLLAYQKSRSGDVVLLSPGCMGTDKFASQQDMGDFFAKLAVTLSQPRKPNVL